MDQVEGQPEDSAAVSGVWPHDMFGIPSNISKGFQKFKGTYNISYISHIYNIIHIYIYIYINFIITGSDNFLFGSYTLALSK